MAHSSTSEQTKVRLMALETSLDPVALLARLRELQSKLSALSDGVTLELVKEPVALAEFLAGLRIAWQGGETRPTAMARAKPARHWRSRIDPFAAVAGDLDRRFSGSPASTGREIFEALQAEYPGVYANRLLRTLQRRIKIWRHNHAKLLIFGAMADRHDHNPGTGKRLTPITLSDGAGSVA